MEIGVYKALEQTLGALFQRRDRLGRRAGRRSRHQQAAGPEPGRDRVQARASLRHQSGRRRRDAARDRRLGIAAFSGVFGADCEGAVGVRGAGGRLRHGAADRLGDATATSISRASREQSWNGQRGRSTAAICEHHFEPEDMASLPGLCRRRSARCAARSMPRCHDLCKPQARDLRPVLRLRSAKLLPQRRSTLRINSQLGHYLGVFVALLPA